MKHLNFFTFLIFNFKILTKQTRKNSNDLERTRTNSNDLQRPSTKMFVNDTYRCVERVSVPKLNRMILHLGGFPNLRDDDKNTWSFRNSKKSRNVRGRSEGTTLILRSRITTQVIRGRWGVCTPRGRRFNIWVRSIARRWCVRNTPTSILKTRTRL